MLGTKIYKNNFNAETYSQCADWCNANGAMIVDKGEYYEVVEIPVHVPTEEEIQKQLTDGVQSYMDTKAQERGYDNIHTACSYVNSTDEVFKAEGAACLAWRDQVWRKCYDILAEVKQGKRAVPILEEVIAELPVLVW